MQLQNKRSVQPIDFQKFLLLTNTKIFQAFGNSNTDVPVKSFLPDNFYHQHRFRLTYNFLIIGESVKIQLTFTNTIYVENS